MITILSPIALFGQRPPVDMQRIKAACNNEIKEIKFSESGGGCFSAYCKTTTLYRRSLHFTTDRSTGIVSVTPANTHTVRTISALDIRLFVNQLPTLLEQSITIQGLGFSRENYARCRSEIDTMRSSLSGSQQLKLKYGFFRRNDTDYLRLYACLERLPDISSAALEGLLEHKTTIPTLYRYEILFNNSDGSYISIRYISGSRYSLFTHWKIDIDGQVVYSTNTKITHDLGKLFSEVATLDKMELLRELVTALYRSAS